MKPKKSTRIVEIPTISIMMTFDEKFYKDMIETKKILEEEENRQIGDGEYIAIVMQELMGVIDALEETCEKQDKVIKTIMGLSEEIENVPKRKDETAPKDMYH